MSQNEVERVLTSLESQASARIHQQVRLAEDAGAIKNLAAIDESFSLHDQRRKERG